MSVAYDFAIPEPAPGFEPERRVPEPAAVPRPSGTRGRIATVSVLHPPADIADVSWRLTRRGRLLLGVLVALAGAALMWAAASSAHRSTASGSGPATVTVRPGDTLWSIASQVAPQSDPRAEVAFLQQRNHLADVDLTPGQVLQVR